MAIGSVGTALSGDFLGSGNLGTTIESADALMKQWYVTQGNLDSLMYGEDDFFKRLVKMPASEMIEGREIVCPVKIGRSPSQSKTFSVAQDAAKNRTMARGRFVIPIDSDFGLGRVENKLIKASRSKMGAVVKLLAEEIDGAIEGLREKRCSALFSPEYKVNALRNIIAEVKTVTAATKSISFKDKGQATNFDIGDSVEAVQPSTGAARGVKTLVEKVNTEAGSITVQTNIAGLAAGDFLIREGDKDKAGLTSLLSWYPARTSTGALTRSDMVLHGLDRATHLTRLAGFYGTVADGAPSAGNLSRTVRTQITKISQLTKGVPSIFVCNPLVEDFLAQEQSANIRLDVSQGGGQAITNIGLGKLGIRHSKGVCEIVSSSFCPIKETFLIDESNFGIEFLGQPGDKFVDFAQNGNGGILLPCYDAPGVEIRVESFGNTVNKAPARGARLSLDDALLTRIQGA